MISRCLTTGSSAASTPERPRRAALAGCRWAEGPLYFAAGRYSRLERHPERPLAALGRNDRRHRRLPPPRGLHQRQHASTARAASSVASMAAAASAAPSTTARSPSSPTGTTASVSTARTMSSSNSDGSIWFTDPAYGIESDYEGHQAESEIGACHVYRVDPSTGRGPHRRRRLRPAQRPRLLARRAPALRLRHRRRRTSPTVPATSASSTSAPTAGSPAATSSPPAPPASSTASGSTTPAGSGPAPATASTATTRTAPCSARCWCRSRSPTSPSAARSGNRLFICGTTSLYSVLLPVNGVKLV